MTRFHDCTRHLRRLAVLLLIPLLVESLPATPIKVFLLGGQSNMRGRASTTGLPAGLANPQEDVLICRGSTGTVGTTLEFLQPNNVALDGATFGPDLTFGRTIADLYPDVDFALLKYAYGGTALVRSPSGENWAYDPDGGSYLKFQQTVANGLALLENAGYEPQIVGMLWHQGESNAGNSQAEYESRLTEFIADVRSLYGANLPFMIGGIHIPDDIPAAADIIAAQQAVASADPFAVFVPVDDLTTSDRWHFDTPSMITLGQRFASYYNSNFASRIDTSGDFTPPTPGQMTWASPPAGVSDNSISMTAVTASDANGVQYYFTCTSGGGHDSGWQDSPTYVDTGLAPSSAYAYTVQARDKSLNHNANTVSSPPAGASTFPPDTNPPPVPTFVTPLGPVGRVEITVSANPVIDGEGSGVEYRFHNTTLATNSGWLSSPAWTDAGLNPGTTYFYTVQSRDIAANQNVSAQSSPQSATTLDSQVTVADCFSFRADFATLAEYSSNPGSDNALSDLYWADSPLTISTSGFSAVGSDKLVVVLALHNSAVNTAPITSLTYGGVSIYGNLVTGSSLAGTASTKNFIFYLDHPATDGDLVIGIDNSTYHVDEVGVQLFALNGTAAGTAYESESKASGAFTPVNALAGDFIVGVAQRNNQAGTITVTNNPPYSEIDLTAGNLTARVGYQVASVSGPTAPSFTGSIQFESMAAFAATTTPQVTVPNVVGLAQAAAESAITSASLTLGAVTTAYSPTVPAGDVISQNPAAGLTVNEGTSVDLMVSLGPPSGLIAIASQFSFANDYGSSGDNTSNTSTATAPITITTGSFSATGSKLVAVLSLHNSAANVAIPTSVTFGGVALNQTLSHTGGNGQRQYIYYLDSVAANGDFVISFTAGTGSTPTIDEVGLHLFALNGAAAGGAYASQTGSIGTGTGILNNPFPSQANAAAGDFVLGVATRNNNNNTLSVAFPYTQTNITAGNMHSITGYDIVDTTGNTAPPFSKSVTGGSTTIQSFAAFAAAAPPSSAYDDWVATNAPNTGNDPSADEDNDGVSNGIEFVVGGTVSTHDLNKLPVVSNDGNNMTFSFQRAQQSTDPSVVASIEVGTDLATWPDVYLVPDAATVGPPVTVVKDSSPGMDTVTLSVPMAPGVNKFARMKVAITP